MSPDLPENLDPTIEDIIVAQHHNAPVNGHNLAVEKITAEIGRYNRNLLSQTLPEDHHLLEDMLAEVMLRLHQDIQNAFLRTRDKADRSLTLQQLIENYTEEDCEKHNITPAQFETLKLLYFLITKLQERKSTEHLNHLFPQSDRLSEYVLDLYETYCSNKAEDNRFGLKFFLDSIFPLSSNLNTTNGRAKIRRHLQGDVKYLHEMITKESEQREWNVAKNPEIALHLNHILDLRFPLAEEDVSFLREILGVNRPDGSPIGQRLIDKVVLVKIVAETIRNL